MQHAGAEEPLRPDGPTHRPLGRRGCGSSRGSGRAPRNRTHGRGFPPDRVRRIPWGIAAPDPVDRTKARARLSFVDGDLVVACLANFTPTKGQDLLVEAVALLRGRFPGMRLVLAGDGPCRAAVADWVRRTGLDDVVSLPGTLDEPWDLLRAADVFALASGIEGLPLVVLESLSQGTPVVATDVGGMPEAVVPEVTGTLVPPGRADKFAEALGALLANEDRRLRMGISARTRYLSGSPCVDAAGQRAALPGARRPELRRSFSRDQVSRSRS